MAKADVPKALGYRDENDVFHLHPVTEEEIAAAQDLAKKHGPKLPNWRELNPAEITAASAAYHEEHLWSLYLRAVEAEGIESDAADLALRNVAVCVRDQGRVAEALDIYPNDSKLLKGAAAVAHPDDAFCDCVPDIIMLEGKRCQRPLYSETKVLSPPHGGQASLWRCLKCGFINITDNVPPQMETIVTRKGSLGGSKTDVDILRI